MRIVSAWDLSQEGYDMHLRKFSGPPQFLSPQARWSGKRLEWPLR